MQVSRITVVKMYFYELPVGFTSVTYQEIDAKRIRCDNNKNHSYEFAFHVFYFPSET